MTMLAYYNLRNYEYVDIMFCFLVKRQAVDGANDDKNETVVDRPPGLGGTNIRFPSKSSYAVQNFSLWGCGEKHAIYPSRVCHWQKYDS